MTTLSTGSTFAPPWPSMRLQAMAALAARVRALLSHVEGARAPRVLARALAENAIHPIDRPLGRTITCESGALWLTFDNTLCDVVLEAGQSHRCAYGNRLLIQALQGSRVLVH